MNANDLKKNAKGSPAAAAPAKSPASQPHGTTEDQIKEMESEGQATKPGQDRPGEATIDRSAAKD